MASSKPSVASSQRSKAPSLPIPPTFLDPTCVIADSAILTGAFPITVGPQTVLHPRATIISNHGPVTIGRGCIISEKAVVGIAKSDVGNASIDATKPTIKDESPSDYAVSMADNVLLEPATTVEGTVGEGSTIQAGARVSRGATVGKHCKVAPLCTLSSGQELPDFGVVFGHNQRRQERPGLEGLRKVVHDKELEVLRKLIPSNLVKWQTPTSIDPRSSKS